MPQLNTLNYLTQTTWTIIIFTIYYYIMKKYIIPIIIEKLYLKNKLNTNKTKKEDNIESMDKFPLF